MTARRQPQPIVLAAGLVLIIALVSPVGPSLASSDSTTARAALRRTEETETTAATGRSSPVWLGLDGQPLPWSSDAEALAFLRAARVVEIGPELDGTTRPHLVLLEFGGVRAHAIFRDVERSERRYVLSSGEVLNHFRDSYVSEVAAFVLDRLLELNAVPPAVIRTIDGTRGSAQLWIENSFSILDRRESGREPPDWDAYNHQVRQMTVFDNLINNVDRNQTNAVIDPGWKIWYIDHTRAFLRGRDLYDPERVVRVGRRLWRRLQEVSDEEIREVLEPLLDRPEIRDLLVRRRRLVEHIRARLQSAGEEDVLFDEPGLRIRSAATTPDD